MTPAELDTAVWAADPAAFLVLPRILRRVIKRDRRLTGFALRAPHRKSFVVGRKSLLEIADRAELGLEESAELPEKVVLLARPSQRDFSDLPRADLLIQCWRLLFHAKVHIALEEKLADGRLDVAAVRRRIHAIGEAEFDEIRTVLGQEELLLPPRDDTSIFIEFAATYLELRKFAPSFLPHYFPGLTDLDAVDARIAEDVDADGLYLAARPAGAPDPGDVLHLAPWADLEAIEPATPTVHTPLPMEMPLEAKYRFLMRRAHRPTAAGNVVRAAIDHARAERCAPGAFAGEARAAIRQDVQRLAQRLQTALELEPSDEQPWKESLAALVKQAPRGIWTVEARLLYDLQKVCVDHEREVYTVDLVEWALSWGRHPIKRHLPHARDVLLIKHLHSAARRLGAARMATAQRRLLASLIDSAIERIEARIRRTLRPIIAAALADVGLVPQDLPERVARTKLVEELLDPIVERGFLTMGHLRDAISRNNLKMPDLAWPFGFLGGDQLLRADKKLSRSLDGIYRRGEFYLRWMQQASSLGFGTKLGRLATRFTVVPFGGSFVILAFMNEVRERITGDKTGIHWDGPFLPAMIALGLFFLGLVNSGWFRSAVSRFFITSYRVLHTVTVEPIRWMIESRFLQKVFGNRWFLIFYRFGVKPLFWSGVAWWFVPGRYSWRTSFGTAVSVFLAANLLLNSRFGRTTEEVAADRIEWVWRRFGVRFFVGVFWFFVDVFKRLLEVVDRLMYAVDEWLRFRSGQGRALLGIKASAGLLWFLLAYFVRFGVNVLLEPQINPIKHFPVVTVAHKLLLGLYHPFAGLLENWLSAPMAWTMSLVVIWCIPGIFGFLVWELKENWRLYAANRRQRLGPLMIGSHGESMGRLLKPGVHSGTLPKRFAKLRRAERYARVDGDWHTVRKHLQAIEHVELSIRRHVEREFLELLAESRCWEGRPPTLDAIHVGVNSVALAFGCPSLAEEPLHISVDAEAGRLIVGVTAAGWTEQLAPRRRLVLITALLGLYKSLGADLVRQQIVSEFPPPPPCYDITVEGLVVWPDETCEVEVLYDLHEGPWIAPLSIRGLARRRLPTLERERLIFAEIPITWQRWVEAWNQDIAGHGHPRDSVAPVAVLPPT